MRIKNKINSPHGGRLINRYVAIESKGNLSDLLVVRLSDIALCDLYNIAEGVFSPLTGFMTKEQFCDVVYNFKVNGVPWTIPIVLDVGEKTAKKLVPGASIALKDNNGKTAGWMQIEDIYLHKKELHARKVFGTLDCKHPGVEQVYKMKDYLLGGKVYVFEHKKNVKSYLSPTDARKIFTERGYKTIAGFQTRNIPHRAHEYLQRCALEVTDGLFLHPIVGWKKDGDFTAEAVIKVYKVFIKDYYPAERVVFGTLKTAMRYAGPKEAVFHAIIRKNYGCTHFIVGRDHAGVGGYYDKYEAHEIFDKVENVGIKILKFNGPFYCSRCDLIVTEKTCGHNSRYHHKISGTLVRKIIRNGKQPNNQIFRPQVYQLLKKEFEKNRLFW